MRNDLEPTRKTALQALIDAEEETLAKIQSEASDKARIDWLDVCAENFKGVDAEINDVLTKQRPQPLGRRR